LVLVIFRLKAEATRTHPFNVDRLF
jgi:hypothetical protein